MASFAESADKRRPQLNGDPVLDRCERLPHSVGMDTLLGEMNVRYARGRFARVCSGLGGVAMRTTRGRVAIDGHHAASFRFRELQIAGYVSRGLFFEAMDAESQSTCNLAEALIEEWDNLPIFARRVRSLSLRDSGRFPDRPVRVAYRSSSQRSSMRCSRAMRCSF